MFCYVYWEFLCVSFGCLLVFGVTQKTFEAVLTAMGLLLLNLLGWYGLPALMRLAWTVLLMVVSVCLNWV